MPVSSADFTQPRGKKSIYWKMSQLKLPKQKHKGKKVEKNRGSDSTGQYETSNRSIIGISKEKREKKVEDICEDIMVKNFPK